MKRIVCILLMLLSCAALADENPLAPFTLTVPGEVSVEIGEGSHTFVHGQTRVVAIRIDRVPDADPALAVIRMMGQFDPQAVISGDIPAAEGFSALEAITKDKYGESIDALTIMVLSHSGDLLLLSGYDMTGSEAHVRGLLDTLLSGLTCEGVPVIHQNK